jgi:hypothetical protein
VRARREARIGFVGRGIREPPHRLLGLRREVIHVEIAVQRDQQVAAVGREAVLDDAGIGRGALPFPARFLLGGQRLVRAGQGARVDQAAMFLRADVVGPQIVAILVVVTALQVGHELAVGRDLDSAQRRAREIRRREQALQWEFPRPRWCGQQHSARQGERYDAMNRDGAAARRARGVC